jgi:hypothetical protein
MFQMPKRDTIKEVGFLRVQSITVHLHALGPNMTVKVYGDFSHHGRQEAEKETGRDQAPPTACDLLPHTRPHPLKIANLL